MGEGFQNQIRGRAGVIGMNELIEKTLTQVPGFVLGLSMSDKREILAFGNRQVFGVESPLPMSPETIFDLGSITKILATTAAMMRLLDTGAISLDDQVEKFMSGWAATEKEEITVRDLLLHRSGLWEWRPLYIHSQDPSDAIRQIVEIPLRYPRNAGRHYSDLGFISLGQILVKVMGESLKASIDDLVLNPLGLRETQFATPVSTTSIAATSFGDSIEREMVLSKVPYPVPEDAANFEHWREHVLIGEVNDGNAFHVFDGVSGHAGLFSSADDLLAYGETMNASFRGEGRYSQRVAQEFLATGPDFGQQLGFRSWTHTYLGCTTEFFGHTGFPGTVLAFSPFHDCAVALMTNRLHMHGVPVSTELLWQPFLDSIHQKLHSA